MGEYKAQRPQFFNGITAWAPLIKPATDPFPYEVAEAIGTTMNLLGLGEDWAPTKEATFEESYNECNFAGSSTTSYSRWSHSTENCRAAKDVMYNGHLGQCTTGVTGNFAAQFFGFFDEFEDFFGFVKNGLSAPILLQQAGKDRTVLNPPQNQFCDEACSDCKLTVYPESEHNIWTEVDSIRNAAMAEAFAYFDAHSDPMQLKFQNALPPKEECGWSWWSWTCFWQFWPRLGAFIGLSGGVAAAGFMFVKRTKTTSEQMKHAPMRDDNKQSDML